MRVTKMRSNFSMIGNFVSFLKENEQRIKNMLLDYTVQSGMEKLPSGEEVKTLLFQKENVHIRFLPVRIDFDYVYANANCTSEKALESAYQFFRLFGEIFYQVSANRIAFVTSGFLDNANHQAVETLTKTFGIAALFGDCQEFSLRLNNVKNYFEPLNSVLDIRAGEAKNAKTNQTLPVLIVNIDVNTLAANKENRFQADKMEQYLSDLVLEEEYKIRIIESL